MSRGRPRKSHSIAELRRLLGQQRKRRTQMLNERKKLQNRIDQIDREIALVDGEGGVAAAVAGGRRNEKPLPDVIESVLKKNGSKPMKIAEIVKGVESAGYQSTSSNFRGIVNQALIKDECFSSPARGQYKLA